MTSVSDAPRVQAGVDRGAKSRQLPRVRMAVWQAGSERFRETRTPVIVAGGVGSSAAVAGWSLDSFERRFGDMSVRAAVDLPPHGVPYGLDPSRHEAELHVSELVALLRRGARCYLNQADMARFPGLADELDLRPFLVPPVFGLNLWVGNDTRSGLHFDGADNVLVQIAGTKQVVLVSPRDTHGLAVFSDTPSKCRWDPDDEGWVDSRRAARVTWWRGDIRPGDVLFIPRGWWHHIVSPGVSFSVNVWHGGQLGAKEQAEALLRTGARPVCRVAWDFVRCGLLGQTFQQRLFSPPPMGVELHRRFVKGRR